MTPIRKIQVTQRIIWGEMIYIPPRELHAWRYFILIHVTINFMHKNFITLNATALYDWAHSISIPIRVLEFYLKDLNMYSSLHLHRRRRRLQQRQLCRKTVNNDNNSLKMSYLIKCKQTSWHLRSFFTVNVFAVVFVF